MTGMPNTLLAIRRGTRPTQASIQTEGNFRQLNQAERIVEFGDSPEGARRAIEIVQARMDILRERAEESNNLNALDLLDEAAEKLQRARDFHDQGENERALVIVRIVMELNQQVARMLGG